MAINTYGKKIREDNNEVYYAFGSNYDNLSGELSISKKKLELTKVIESPNKIDELAYFKIGCKAIKNFKKDGEFPDFVNSIS